MLSQGQQTNYDEPSVARSRHNKKKPDLLTHFLLSQHTLIGKQIKKCKIRNLMLGNNSTMNGGRGNK